VIGTVLTLGVLVAMVSVVVSAVVVNFPDPGLEAAIRDAISKPTGGIYDTDLVGLAYLNAGNRSISNLEGIQHCKDLTTLHLYDNQITDISTLSDLTNLTHLDLDSNQIVNISALSGLINLTWLNLGGNEIVDISPLVSNLGWGLGDREDIIDLGGNCLDLSSGSPDTLNLNTLRSRGVSFATFLEFQKDCPKPYVPAPDPKPYVRAPGPADLQVSWEAEWRGNSADGVYVNIEVKVENIGTGESSGTSCWFGMEESMNWFHDQTDFREYDISPNGWRRYTDSLWVPFGVWTKLVIIIRNDQGDYIRKESWDFYTG